MKLGIVFEHMAQKRLLRRSETVEICDDEGASTESLQRHLRRCTKSLQHLVGIIT